ncbi:MAG: recombinase zinc beta ribbon domain-containing protein, partial [Anaerolineales bacterium]
RKSRRNNRKNEYLLRSLVVCGMCGSMASGYVSNKKTYYSCGAKRNRNLTTKPHDEKISVRHKQLDQKVWAGLTQLLDDPANLEAQIEQRLYRYNAEVKGDRKALDKLDKEIEKFAIQETRLIDAYREGVIDLKELKEQKGKVSKRLKVLAGKKKAALSQQEGPGRTEITMEMLGDISARFRRAMANADFETREKIVNNLVNSIELFQDKAIVSGVIPINPDALVPSQHAAH